MNNYEDAQRRMRMYDAGPELYEALRPILAAWDSLTHEPVPEQLNVPKMWKAARAALAKADGVTARKGTT